MSKCRFMFAHECSEDEVKKLNRKLKGFGVKIHQLHPGATDHLILAVCPRTVSKKKATETYDRMSDSELGRL